MTIKSKTDAVYYFPDAVVVQISRQDGQVTATRGIALMSVYNVLREQLHAVAKCDLQLTQGEINALMARLATRRVAFEAEEGLELLPAEPGDSKKEKGKEEK